MKLKHRTSLDETEKARSEKDARRASARTVRRKKKKRSKKAPSHGSPELQNKNPKRKGRKKCKNSSRDA